MSDKKQEPTQPQNAEHARGEKLDLTKKRALRMRSGLWAGMGGTGSNGQRKKDHGGDEG